MVQQVEYKFSDTAQTQPQVDADTISEMGDVITKPRRGRKRKDVANYTPDYAVLTDLIPEALLNNAKTLVSNRSRGVKTVLRTLQSAEFHKRQLDEYTRMAQFHQDHNAKLVKKLSEVTGDAPRVPASVNSVKGFLNTLEDAVLDQIATSRGVSTDLTREEMVTILAQKWHGPTSTTN